MSVMFSSSRGGFLVEMEPMAAVCLEELLDETRQDPVLAAHPDLAALADAVARSYADPVTLTEAGAFGWLRGLATLRHYLARSLAVESGTRTEVLFATAALAVDSPVATAARAFLWVGMLAEELTAVLAAAV